MPRIQLQSAHHFSTWLHNEIVAEVPFGLSLRLRPLPMQGLATASGGGLVLVRPHVGHILASLTAETPVVLAELGADDGDAVETVELDGAAVSRPASGCIQPTSGWYAFFLRTLMHLTSTNVSLPRHTETFSSSSSATCTVATTDGVGRKTALYATMLSHCAEWWDAGKTVQFTGARLYPHSLSMQRAMPLYRPFVFFDVMSEAAGRLADPSRLSGRGGSNSATRQRLLRVLHLLSVRGGWQLCVQRSSRSDESNAAATPSPTLLRQEEGWVHMDWLDYLTERCVEVDLRPAGDYNGLESLLRGAASQVWLDSGSATHSMPIAKPAVCTRSCGCVGGGGAGFAFAVPDVFVPLCAVLWHILSTEVEGAVLATLHRLLQQYLCGPFLAPSDRAGIPSTMHRGEETSILRYAFHALQTLVYSPGQAFACDLTHSDRSSVASSSASALSPPVAGPVTLSCIIPNGVCLLPLARDSASSRFFLQGLPTLVAPDGIVLRRHLLRVLLLRVDPEGDWLPPPEKLASQRSFYASFDAQRGGPCEGEDSGSEMSDDFALQEAREAGRRTVTRKGTAAAGQRTPPASLPSPPLSADHFLTEDRVISTLTAHVIHSGPFAQAVASARGLDRCLWLAAIRLFVYALLHGARVVITPERLPTFVNTFGYRHVPQLHRRLCELRGTFRKAAEDGGTLPLFTDIDDVPTGAAVISLLDAACQREPPIAVYVVDQVSLSGFSKLQVRSGVSGTAISAHAVSTAPASLPLLPILLCCDVLRHPCSFDEARDSSTPSGICELAHCGVLDVAELCHVSACWQPQKSPCSAEALMTRCAEVVASQDRDAPGMHDSRVFIAALHLVVTPSLTDVEDGASTQSVEWSVDNQARCGVHVDPWKAAAVESELRQPLLPTLLLVAPIQLQTVLYAGLLRKAALALLEALPNPCAGEAIMPNSMWDTARTGHSNVRGVVRGGGAFFVSLAAQARWLMRRLSLSPACAAAAATLTGVGVATPRPFASSDPVSWGIGVGPQDHATIRFVLAILCESCAAMVTQLAQPLIEGGAAVGHLLSPLPNAQAFPVTRGRRARRRLWIEALRAAVEAPSAVPGQSLLHISHKSVDVMLSAEESGTAVGACFGANTLHERAMQWLSSDRCFSSPTSQSGGCSTEPPSSNFPFLEPLHTNARAVREALALVLRTLSATVS
ncbi:conserved hypothetical protein [Leishmania braziliensis MHOM/BR/75/M2904]|uniref:Uncharacterized protein n=2 Tax=Leishmania braziliensis TaxID=5660 RepID=A4HKW9_LEIBR|nr:conserved hypothetical protein [Leishmania braziliensis MHOM/BR/75/M2904]CAJ2478886.1 unnamed protein product [Leishmania braziliensis]CAM43148.1 conserved hypothetical protein [Leishmania braziliensis MHOM/BR/75/M2904]SYZ68857.1 hypothetical_protein [Leishmania braziliensis MHOM/BR/75/M2904]